MYMTLIKEHIYDVKKKHKRTYMTLIKELIEKTDIRVYYVVYLVLIFCLQRFVKAFPPERN